LVQTLNLVPGLANSLQHTGVEVVRACTSCLWWRGGCSMLYPPSSDHMW